MPQVRLLRTLKRERARAVDSLRRVRVIPLGPGPARAELSRSMSGVGPYRPLNSGFLFSMNDRLPSLASSESETGCSISVCKVRLYPSL